MKFKPTLSDVLGFCLFGITAIYSIEYFARGTATVFDAWKSGAMAFFFEAAKVILWRRGWDKRNVLFVLVSLPFFCISFVSAGGSSMIYLAKSTDTVASIQGANIQTQIDQTDAQIRLLQKRLEAVANDPNAPTASLRTELGKAMESRSQLSESLIANKDDKNANADGADMVMSTLAGVLGIPKKKFELLFMFSRAILLELGAMAATTPIMELRRRNQPKYIRSARLPVGHIVKADGITTLCGLTIEDGIATTINTPLCGNCTSKWNGEK